MILDIDRNFSIDLDFDLIDVIYMSLRVNEWRIDERRPCIALR